MGGLPLINFRHCTVKKSIENEYLCNRGCRSFEPFTKLQNLCQIYNFCKKPKALMASVTELRILEHLKHHGERGDAERVLPPGLPPESLDLTPFEQNTGWFF